MSDRETAPVPPGRAEVAAQWRALVAGEVTREAAHAWAVPWVEGEGAFADFEDPLVVTALQYLHGFDLRRDPGRPNLLRHDLLRHGAAGEGEWCRSPDDIADGFVRWQAKCAAYDADPQGWSRAVREQAQALARAEGARLGR
ncbi:hypothetical protein ACWGB8_18890 [Kitasatospora sp. NPDC054939]